MGYPKQPNKPGLGETLRAQRKRAGMTMGDLARASGLPLVTVSDIERGRGGTNGDVRTFIGALPVEPKARMVLEACADLCWPSPPITETKSAKGTDR